MNRKTTDVPKKKALTKLFFRSQKSWFKKELIQMGRLKGRLVTMSASGTLI